MDHINDAASCGRLLTRLRRRSGYSSRVVAAKSGLNHSTLLQWEKGTRMPMAQSLVLILRFYGETATIGWDPPDPDREEES